MGKIADFHNHFDIKLKWGLRVLFLMFVAGAVVIGIINGQKSKNATPVDHNVYLNEEIIYAKEVHLVVNSINVTVNEGNEGELDDDADSLSKYALNLGLVVEQVSKDIKEEKVKIVPSNFKLKSVNLKAKSKMAVYFECLAKETLAAMISGGVTGTVNVLEETINFAEDYTLESINDAHYSKTDFKPIKCNSDSFEPFYPRDIEGATNIALSFPIKQEYLDSENVIVLAIDALDHIERRIFLITRPANFLTT